jgi:hypothetical protein
VEIGCEGIVGFETDVFHVYAVAPMFLMCLVLLTSPDVSTFPRGRAVAELEHKRFVIGTQAPQHASNPHGRAVAELESKRFVTGTQAPQPASNFKCVCYNDKQRFR